MRRLIQAFRRHPVLTPLFLLAAALTLMFTIRTVVFTIYWANPAHKQQQIEPWMTPRYLAHSWDLTPEQVARALDISPDTARGITLGEIARQKGISLEELTARLAEAASRAQETPQ